MRYVTKLSEVPLYESPPGAHLRSIGAIVDTGKSDELTIGLLILSSGSKTVIDYHEHDEAYFLTRGTGYELLWLNGEDKDPEQFEIEAGSAVFIPRSVRHQMVNTGQGDIWVIWFFPRHTTRGLHAQFPPKTWVERKMPQGEWYPRGTE